MATRYREQGWRITTTHDRVKLSNPRGEPIKWFEIDPPKPPTIYWADEKDEQLTKQ